MSRSSAECISDPELQRQNELDALAGIFPAERREALAALLTNEDVATLKHLAEKGIGANTLHALASDLGYLEAWALAATSLPLPWPAPEGLALKFLAHHLWDPAKREATPGHSMPVAERLKTDGNLRADGPHAPATVRRLANWATLHRWRGLEAYFITPTFKTALRLAILANTRPPMRKSQRAVTRAVLNRLVATCAENRLVDLRDRALLLTAFASGGRRRSELASLRVDQIETLPPVPVDPRYLHSVNLPCMAIRLGRTKRGNADDGARILLIGRPAEALKTWLTGAKITSGAVFRPIDRWGRIAPSAISGDGVNDIAKGRCKQAGLDPALFSAHGLRSGYLTQAARDGESLPEAMQQSQHRSVQQAATYYNDGERQMGKAARLAWR
jgi:integrase